MDALQQSHRFMRTPPPPPSMADPQSRPPPSQGPWFSGQFQYQTQPSPPLPPHQQTPWLSHSDHQHIPPAYPTHPHHNPVPPYPAHPHHNQYLPPPRPHMPPLPPSHHHPYPNPTQVAQPYPQSNQTWGNPNWSHHGWEYPDTNISHNNEEDWAARARAWATANVSIENQHPPSQFSPVGRLEEHSNSYHDQYQQTADPPYTEIQQSLLPASSHQQFPVSSPNLYRSPVNHMQESTSFSSGQSISYVSDGHTSYTTRDGALVADSNPVFTYHGSVPTSSSIYQQEVPSSYSSVPGREEARDQNYQFHKPSPLPMSSAQEEQTHVQSMLPAMGRSTFVEQPHVMYDNLPTDPIVDPSDRPLVFDPKFTRDHNPHPQASFMHPDLAGHGGSVDSIASVPSIHAWTTPVAPGMVYPPVPPVPSGSQFDPSFVAPAPVTGHATPIFGRIPGPNFRPTIQSGGAPFDLGPGAVIHPTTAFPGDANGILNISERPKKASVPNWLREEIIKNKAVLSSSVQEHPDEDPFQPIGDEGVDKSSMKGDLADSKSIDSSRSTEDEDNEEDDVEAARTVAINQEIKRVLTEVLLKVTDELFDEIATKVLSEDDMTVEVDHNPAPPNHKVLSSPPAVPTPKASAKVLIPGKAKESEVDVSGKSSASSPGDVLGLASYASDDDEEEIQSSRVPTTRQTDVANPKSTNDKLAGYVPNAVKNVKGPSGGQKNTETDRKRTVQSVASSNHFELGNGMDKVLDHEQDGASSALEGFSGIREDMINVDGEKMVEKSNVLESNNIIGEKDHKKPELSRGNVIVKKSMTNDSHSREARNKSDNNDGYDSRRSSTGKDFVKKAEPNKTKAYERKSDSSDSRKRDERHARKEKIDKRNGSRDRVNDRGAKPVEKEKESDLRKGSAHVSNKDDQKEVEKVKKVRAKEDSNRKRERVRDEKGDKSRHGAARDSGRHKRHRSSSVSSRGRNSKDNSVGSHYGNSSDEASEDSRERKLHTKRQSLSPSPIRSKRRQVSRSPHSKHSQRRHSPYSSLETTRGRRSRSNSPVRRR